MSNCLQKLNILFEIFRDARGEPELAVDVLGSGVVDYEGVSGCDDDRVVDVVTFGVAVG